MLDMCGALKGFFCRGAGGGMALAALFSLSTSAGATVVVYEVDNVGGSTFEYRYVVENDGTEDVEEISIYFDVGLFENLRMASAPVGWDPLVLQPDPLLMDDGIYDALALVPGIPPGGVLGGFSVWADFLGTGVPGSQRFEILDPVSFDVLDSGFTRLAAVDVPEPASLWTASFGLLAMMFAVGRRERG